MKPVIREVISTLRNFHTSPGYPSVARLYITSRCNMKCLFCELGQPAITRAQSTDELTTGEWRDIISDLKSWGVHRLYITGGEPLLRPDIWELLDHCRKIRMRISGVTTNGLLLSKLSDDRISILNDTVDCIIISLDSCDSDTHDRVRGVKGSFDRILQFLSSPPEGFRPRLHILGVVTRQSITHILSLVRFAHKHDIRFVGFQPVNFYSNFPDIETLPEKDTLLPQRRELESLKSEIDEAARFAAGTGMNTNLPLLRYWIEPYFLNALNEQYFFQGLVRKFQCFSMYQQILIDWQGNVLPCSLLQSAGNARSDNITEIWRERLQPVRNSLRTGKYYPECRSCFCEFPLNLRYSIINSPVSNWGLLMKLSGYYLKRVPTRY